MSAARIALPVVLGLALCACLSPTVERGDQPFATVGDRVAFDDDPRFVLRDRLALEDGQPATIQGQPFSQRGRKWHVYPFTVYAPARFHATLRVNDPLMQHASAVWLVGPQEGDGRWPVPAPAATAGGLATVSGEAAGYGQWAIVVGPRDASGFRPRYPSRMAFLRPVERAADGAETLGAETLARIDVIESIGSTTRAELTVGSQTFEVLSPAPGNADALDPRPGARFAVLGEEGPATFELARFWVSTNLVSDAGESVLANLGFEAAGVLTLHPMGHEGAFDHADERFALVLEAVGPRGEPSAQPHLLRAVPGTHEGRDVVVRPCPPDEALGASEDETTADGECREAVHADDESPVPADLIESWRQTFFDPTERSTYDLEVACDEGCGAPVGGAAAQAWAPSAALPRFPVYFAHGFNSSRDVWAPVREALGQKDERWAWWSDARNVPPFEPVRQRAEALRQNLAAFLQDLRAHDPASRAALASPRLNVVAHSMGGLDARVLMHVPEWNDESCGEPRCSDAAGTPQSCCPLDDLGHGVPWVRVIASLTTLSTPHGGSSFADWGARLLVGSRIVNQAFRIVADRFFGLEAAGQERMRHTFVALSRKYSGIVMRPSVPVPLPERAYDWGCATRGECATQQGAGPVRDGGGHRLPAPAERATVFSWASTSCINGGCGDIIDPMLIVSYRHVMAKEADCDGGRNDGVVSTCSARFGIFMGVRANDHFHWNRIGASGVVALAARLFGLAREPADEFHRYWLGELARAGY